MMPGCTDTNQGYYGQWGCMVTLIHVAYAGLAFLFCPLLFGLCGHKSGTLLRRKGEKRCKVRMRPEHWKTGKETKKNIKTNANYTKPSGKGRAWLVAGSACEFDLPGSLPSAALSVLISCNPIATSETNQTAESSLFLIRKAQDHHLTLWFLSELQAAATEKNHPG